MNLSKKNILEIAIVIFAVGGFLFSFYNVMHEKILKSENRFEISQLTDEILQSQKNSDAFECNSMIYLQNEEESVQDPSWAEQIIHDFEHEKIYIKRDKSEELMEYADDEVAVYTKGVTEVYSKEEKKIQTVSQNDWYYYECEDIYGANTKNAVTDRLSYGYLEDIDNIIDIKKTGTAEYEGVNNTRYTVTIQNTLRDDMTEDMGDTGLRKMLGSKGLNVMMIQKAYPEVYELLKKIYDSETEEMQVWLSDDGKMTRIEKDCTFTYYIEVMKGNSDVIENKVGQYNYPRVSCIQNYKYSPESAVIKMPQSFKEL
ncbi:MAG: hypothetical protein J5983_06945 [Ruminococcus sp.]|nr:hypothetical protein [Ruminococcus sp.]